MIWLMGVTDDDFWHCEDCWTEKNQMEQHCFLESATTEMTLEASTPDYE